MSFYQRTIIRSLSAAVIVVDPHGRITLWNPAAERLLGLTELEAEGQLLWTLRIPILSRKLVAGIRKNLAKKLAFRLGDLTYERAVGARGYTKLSAIPLVQDGRALGAVILLEDTTRVAVAVEERADELPARARRQRARESST